jgi:hypothetical protein
MYEITRTIFSRCLNNVYLKNKIYLIVSKLTHIHSLPLIFKIKIWEVYVLICSFVCGMNYDF